MLQRTPKPAFWKFVKGSAKILFICEAVAFAASYGFYYRLNTRRDFREYMNNNYPFVLDYYYKLGETLGDSDLRQIDSVVWNAQRTPKEN